jgi:hypothetical protein
VVYGTLIDAHWHLFVDYDIELAKKARRRQIVFLARYGRQSMFVWDDLPVSVLDEKFQDLKELLDDEGGGSEDLLGEV